MHARMTTLQGSPGEADAALRQIDDEVIPGIKGQDGFTGLLALLDRDGGKMIAITFWESEEAMRASEEAANRLRESTASAADEEIVGVDRFEVVHDSRS
jgi:heme-degrading monooxygenase HmoA